MSRRSALLDEGFIRQLEQVELVVRRLKGVGHLGGQLGGLQRRERLPLA